MDPTQSNDASQVGTNTSQSVLPSQPNYLTPQQRMQMAMYSNGLMNKPLPPANSMTQGASNMVNSFMQGQNQGNMMNGQPSSGNSFLSNLFSGNSGNSPMQLPSANGGGSPMGILQGLFGGGGNNVGTNGPSS